MDRRSSTPLSPLPPVHPASRSSPLRSPAPLEGHSPICPPSSAPPRANTSTPSDGSADCASPSDLSPPLPSLGRRPAPKLSDRAIAFSIEAIMARKRAASNASSGDPDEDDPEEVEEHSGSRSPEERNSLLPLGEHSSIPLFRFFLFLFKHKAVVDLPDFLNDRP